MPISLPAALQGKQCIEGTVIDLGDTGGSPIFFPNETKMMD